MKKKGSIQIESLVKWLLILVVLLLALVFITNIGGLGTKVIDALANIGNFK